MTVIFCNKADLVSQQLHHEMLRRKQDCIIVYDTDLSLAKKWIHRSAENGKFETEIQLSNGFVLQSDQITCAVNRLRYISMWHFKEDSERSYAEMEMMALVISYLQSLDNKLLHPLTLSQFVSYSDNDWNLLVCCARAGLPVIDRMFSSSPRWKNFPGWNIYSCQRNQQGLYRKMPKSPAILNTPVLYMENIENNFTTAVISGMAAEKLPFELNDKYLDNFYHLTQLGFCDMTFAKTADGYKVQRINPFPSTCSVRAIELLATTIANKN